MAARGGILEIILPILQGEPMSESENKIRVLVVDDDVDQLMLLERTLNAYGFEVRTHRSSLGVSNLVRHATDGVLLLRPEGLFSRKTRKA